MKNVWKVKFDAKYTGCGELMPESRIVVSNGDGESAIKKAKKLVIGTSFYNDGKKCRCVWAKLYGLKKLDSLDG